MFGLIPFGLGFITGYGVSAFTRPYPYPYAGPYAAGPYAPYPYARRFPYYY